MRITIDADSIEASIEAVVCVNRFAITYYRTHKMMCQTQTTDSMELVARCGMCSICIDIASKPNCRPMAQIDIS